MAGPTFFEKLRTSSSANDSLLCVGLDPDLSKIPTSLARTPDPLSKFNKAIIDATAEFACAFKPNSAFYEAHGTDGLRQLRATIAYVKQNHPDIPVILDSKRADIGNTNNGYVASSFDDLQVDAITLHPYLGQEALEPFLERTDKGIIILCRTSNPGAGEFQDLLIDGQPLYQYIAKSVANGWNKNNNCLLVVGATYPDELKIIREIAGPDMYFLVPGVGAQGGDIAATLKAGGERLIINSSRAILYASSGEDFADAARAEARRTRDEINRYREAV